MSHTYEELQELYAQKKRSLEAMEKLEKSTNAALSLSLVRQRVAEQTVKLLTAELDDEVRRRGGTPPDVNAGIADAATNEADSNVRMVNPMERIHNLRGALRHQKLAEDAFRQALTESVKREKEALDNHDRMSKNLSAATARIAELEQAQRDAAKASHDLFRDEQMRWQNLTGFSTPEHARDALLAWKEATTCKTPDGARALLASATKEASNIANEWKAATMCNTPGEARQMAQDWQKKLADASDARDAAWHKATGSSTPQFAEDRERQWRVATNCQTPSEAQGKRDDHVRLVNRDAQWRTATGCVTPAEAEKMVRGHISDLDKARSEEGEKWRAASRCHSPVEAAQQAKQLVDMHGPDGPWARVQKLNEELGEWRRLFAYPTPTAAHAANILAFAAAGERAKEEARREGSAKMQKLNDMVCSWASAFQDCARRASAKMPPGDAGLRRAAAEHELVKYWASTSPRSDGFYDGIERASGEQQDQLAANTGGPRRDDWDIRSRILVESSDGKRTARICVHPITLSVSVEYLER